MSTENFVARGLRSLGLEVQRIEVGATKTPDLLLLDTSNTYLLEIKDKFPDPDTVRRRAEVLDRGGIWEEEKPLAYRNAISHVIREAAAQLYAFQAEPVDFRLVWLHARDRHEETQLIQFQATLYGSVDIIDLAEITGSVPARPCFYFDFSEFFRLRDVLDGAFVSTDEGGLLCVNSMSPRYQPFRNSGLCKAFPGVCDPVERERLGEAYIANCDISRKKRTTILDYVKKKYGRPQLIEWNPKHYSAEIRASRQVDDDDAV